MVWHVVEKSGIPANLLELEITENVTMHGIDKVREKLDELSSLGVFFSIDDFGTSNSTSPTSRPSPSPTACSSKAPPQPKPSTTPP